MDFGKAIEALKAGKRVARAGWNGKGMYLFLATDMEFHTAADLSEFNPGKVEQACPENAVHVHDSICMRTAQKTIVVGWLASQTDMLADDWQLVEG